MEILKPQNPIIYKGEKHIYPLTTADQIILADNSRLEKNGKIMADALNTSRTIALVGDVIGDVTFDGSEDVVINTNVKASNFYNATLSASNWAQTSEGYIQTVSVEGMSADLNPIVDIDMSTATIENKNDLIAAWGMVERISTGYNNIIAYCYEEAPTVDIKVNFLVVK